MASSHEGDGAETAPGNPPLMNSGCRAGAYGSTTKFAIVRSKVAGRQAKEIRVGSKTPGAAIEQARSKSCSV
jgi:hypothetical protein